MIKRKPFVTLALAILSSIFCSTDELNAQEATTSAPAALELPLWPHGAPLATGDQAKDIPTLIVSFPANATQSETPLPALVICPGGGYGHLAMGHEGTEIAAWANSLGMVAAICNYRHRNKGYGHPAPLMDAQRAVRFVRTNAAGWNVDPERIGILGFSAGGHLVSTVLTHLNPIQSDGSFLETEVDTKSEDPVDMQSSRPNFGILCYPVIGMGVDWTHKGSEKNLFGENPPAELLAMFNNHTQVTSETPPTFLFHTQEDKAVPVQNSLEFYSAMARHNVPGELHVFQNGQHGVGLAASHHGANAWPSLAVSWLQNRGILPQNSNAK